MLIRTPVPPSAIGVSPNGSVAGLLAGGMELRAALLHLPMRAVADAVEVRAVDSRRCWHSVLKVTTARLPVSEAPCSGRYVNASITASARSGVFTPRLRASSFRSMATRPRASCS